MGYFRLFRRIKIAPGVTINVSKSGLSTSFGPKGAKVTVGRRGVRRTVGIPGTGVYYTSTTSRHDPASPPPTTGQPARSSSGISARAWMAVIAGVVLLAAVVGSCLGGKSGEPSPTAPPAALGLIGQRSSGGGTAEPLATEDPNLTATQSPALSKTPATTPKPRATAKPTPKPTSKPTTTISVKVTSHTAAVSRNGTASVRVKTAARAKCSIEVVYNSGPSTAAGLGDKTASATGVVSWSWKVGGRTAYGTYPIYITCALASRTGSASTSFKVR